VSLIRYAWGANWPVKGTIALTVDLGALHAWQFSVTYELEKNEDDLSRENLWRMMRNAIQVDGINLPNGISGNRLDYRVSCEKSDQSIHVLWRQKLENEELTGIPQDHGLPVCSVYGKKKVIRMRHIDRIGLGVQGIVHNLYGPDMQIFPLQSNKWSFNAVMGRSGKDIGIPEDVAAEIQENAPEAVGFNEAVRESTEITANVDKGFEHYIKYFRDDLRVTTEVSVEAGHHGEYGWGVYFEQGRHRMVLAGTLANRPKEEIEDDVLWLACAEWANFEPVL
jgi:hypothetical protein